MVWKYGWILWRRYWVKRHRVKKEAIAESGSLTIYVLAKVSLQQTLKCLAVAGLILSHLMNGVMNCVQVQGLCSLSQVELAGGSAVLSGNSHLQILLGGGGNNLA